MRNILQSSWEFRLFIRSLMFDRQSSLTSHTIFRRFANKCPGCICSLILPTTLLCQLPLLRRSPPEHLNLNFARQFSASLIQFGFRGPSSCWFCNGGLKSWLPKQEEHLCVRVVTSGLMRRLHPNSWRPYSIYIYFVWQYSSRPTAALPQPETKSETKQFRPTCSNQCQLHFSKLRDTIAVNPRKLIIDTA